MTLKEFGLKLEELNEAYDELTRTEEKPRKPEIGETIEVAGITWRVLDKLESGYLVISEDFYGEKRPFDSNCNNWIVSNLRNELNIELKNKIEDELGTGVLVPFERNLLSLDGQDEYGTCEDVVSMLTVDEYRKYRKLLPNKSEYWWTITPDSTPCNRNSKWICIVSPGGDIDCDCYYDRDGVRPVCILKSDIFVSRVEEEDDE